MRYDTLIEAIGRTPIVRLHRVAAAGSAEVWAKLDGLNPGGSAKDRPARAMVEAAERAGRLKPGDTIVEPSGGNTGVGLAWIAAVRGYRCIVVLPKGTSAEKITVLRAYGAEVVEARADVDPEHDEGYIGTAARIAKERAAYYPDQFENTANPGAHVSSTAEEIWTDLDGRVDAFVACVGSGGTLSGVGRALRAHAPGIKLIRVVPFAADASQALVVRGESDSQGRPTAVEGVGPFDPDPAFGCPHLDEVAWVPDAEAFAMARRLAREEGLLVGGSSGAAVTVALKLAATLPPQARVVAFCPDTGRNYLSGFLRG